MTATDLLGAEFDAIIARLEATGAISAETPLYAEAWRAIGEQDVAQQIRDILGCKTCGAVADEPCKTVSGAEARQAHRGRLV